ncbi:MAG: Spy/CpxP family protein refolding chaperone [Caldisericia bacterium]
MNKKTLTILVLVILIGLISIGGVYAGSFVKRFSDDRDGNIFFWLKKLNLTEEQKTKIEEILKGLKEESKLILDEIKELSTKEKDIISKEVIDEVNLNLVVESQIKNLIKLSYLKKDAYLKIVDILDNNQRKIFPTFTLFLRSRPFLFENEKVDDFMDKINSRIRDLIKIGKRLNLTEEQEEILREMIKEENNKKFKFLHQLEMRFLIKKLDLTEDQIDKINDLFANEKEKEKDIFIKIRDNNSKQREILNSEKFDRNILSNYIDEYITFESKILNLRKNLYFEFLKVLTLEQRKKSPTSLFFFKIV